jgi:hypothetical protein
LLLESRLSTSSWRCFSSLYLRISSFIRRYTSSEFIFGIGQSEDAIRASIEIGRFLCNFLVFFAGCVKFFLLFFVLWNLMWKIWRKIKVKGGGLKILSFLEIFWGWSSLNLIKKIWRNFYFLLKSNFFIF